MSAFGPSGASASSAPAGAGRPEASPPRRAPGDPAPGGVERAPPGRGGLLLRLLLRGDRAHRRLARGSLPRVGLGLREGCAPGAPLPHGLRCGLRRGGTRLDGGPRLRLLVLLELVLLVRLLVPHDRVQGRLQGLRVPRGVQELLLHAVVLGPQHVALPGGLVQRPPALRELPPQGLGLQRLPRGLL